MNEEAMKALHALLDAVGTQYTETLQRNKPDELRQVAAAFEAFESRLRGVLVGYQGKLRAKAFGR